ncbi:hypothetical protein ACFWX8_34030, partial [Streptomyces violascens]
GQGRRPVRARPHGSYQDGPTGVGFLIDGSPICLEGTMSSRATEADAFGGCPDHFGCDQPRGGH